MADRKAEQGAVQYGQERWSFENNDSRLAGAGQIANEIRRLVEQGEYTDYVSGLSVKGRLINRMIDVVYWPRKLFQNGELGTWFDPSDMSTLFQDAAGTTPVTAVEQPVSLMLDKSKGLVIGPELKGSFAIAVLGSPTVLATYNTITGEGTFRRDTVNTASCVRITGLTANRFYKVTVTNTSNQLISVRQNQNNIIVSNIAVGATTTVYVSTGEYQDIVIYGNVDATNYTFTLVSAVEIAGNHAYTPSSASTSRPTLSARKNWLLATETLATQNVTTRAVPYVLSFWGTGTITLSGTSTAGPLVGTGADDRVYLEFTPTAGTLTLTVSGTVSKAQLEEANDGVS